MDYIALGKQIRERRKKQRLTQAGLAKAAGISLSFLGHIERGSRKASLETVVKLANVLNISTDRLLMDSLDIAPGGMSSDCLEQFSALREIISELESKWGNHNADAG